MTNLEQRLLELSSEFADLATELASKRLETLNDPPPPPIPMILHCPKCTERHIDRGEFAMKFHHTHACQSCGFVWRPAVVATVGVQFLPGFKDRVETRAFETCPDHNYVLPCPAMGCAFGRRT